MLSSDALRSRPAVAEVGEYEVKAALLYHFAKFAEWPAEAFPTDQAPIVIAVLGESPFGATLTTAIEGKLANRRRVTVLHYPTLEDLNACHILFVSASEGARLPKTLDGIGSRGILTVSDIEAFARSGGMIGLTTEEGRVHFEINLEVVTNAHLRLSAKLLSLAKIVGPTPQASR